MTTSYPENNPATGDKLRDPFASPLPNEEDPWEDRREEIIIWKTS